MSSNKKLLDLEELKNLLRSAIQDMLTLDVITAKGNYDVVIPTQDDWDDLVSKLSQTPNNIRILARTHIQLDADRVSMLPEESLGDFSQEYILNYHQKSVEVAEKTRIDRLNFIKSILEIIVSNPGLLKENSKITTDGNQVQQKKN
ncbi:hypothetical protein [Candidatus Nitrosocosmicus sp. T]